MGAEDILRRHLRREDGNPPEWVEAIIKGTAECKAHYERVACTRVDGWAFLMPRETFLRTLKKDRSVASVTLVADIAIDPEGRVRKHRWSTEHLECQKGE